MNQQEMLRDKVDRRRAGTRARITPQLLRWARQRAGLTPEEMASRLGLKAEQIQRWEQGLDRPTLRQAQHVAHILHVPLGYLFLSAPPPTTAPIADWRTLPQVERGRFSPNLQDTIHDAMRKRDWLREWRMQEGMAALPFVGCFSSESSPQDVAEDIRARLDLPVPTAKGVRSWQEHLNRLVRQAETAGIVILQNSVVGADNRRPLSVEEFRGFALVDAYAPVIFLNARDTIAGRIFTLAHELAHVWSGTSGVSNPTPKEPAAAPAIERFCNRVAAELLVPNTVFRAQWSMQKDPGVLTRAQALAEFFRVSALVILVRAYEQGYLGREVFEETYERALQQAMECEREIPARTERKGSFYNTWRVRNGRVLVRELLLALQQGNVLYREAAQLLNVRLSTLEKALQLFQGRESALLS